MTDRRYFRATDPDGSRLKVVDPKTGEEFGDTYEADIGQDGKNGNLIRFFVENGKVKCTDWTITPEGRRSRMLMMVMDPRDFDVVDRDTQEVLATSRRVPLELNVESEPEEVS